MTVKTYKDPMLNVRGPQSHTIGAWKAAKHKPKAMKKVRLASSNPSRWASKGR